MLVATVVVTDLVEVVSGKKILGLRNLKNYFVEVREILDFYIGNILGKRLFVLSSMNRLKGK